MKILLIILLAIILCSVKLILNPDWYCTGDNSIKVCFQDESMRNEYEKGEMSISFKSKL